MIKQINYLLFLSFLLFTNCKKENPIAIECWVWQNGGFEFITISKAAEYKNRGDRGFTTDVIKRINYPAEARETGVEGTVDLTYEISMSGSIENVVIVNDIGAGCGEVGKEAIESVPSDFSPAEINGNPVRVRKEMSVRFRLE